MVVRVYGKVDGHDLIFSKCSNGTWDVQVPYDEDGEYVAEIVAEDEAGNIAYIATLLYAILNGEICFHKIVKKFEIDAMPFRCTFAAQGGGYGFLKIGRGYIFELKKPTCRKEK